MERATMTVINYVEYNSLKSFDHALIWAIIRLRECNQHPENTDLLDYVTIRPEARDFIKWSTQLDEEGQPFFTASLLFPLRDDTPLVSRPIPMNIPTYTDFELPSQPMSVPATGRGLPVPEIPAEINTLERLACWLCLIAHRAGEFIGYINAINTYGFLTQTAVAKPSHEITPAGLTYDKTFNFATIANGISGGGEGEGGGGEGGGGGGGGGGSTTASEAFAAFESTPQSPNNADLAERLEELRENNRVNQEPPQVDPGRGYDRIDTLPICRDQDPSIKAFNTPLAKLLNK
jgi:uncharacterized membrane protein YgcG